MSCTPPTTRQSIATPPRAASLKPAATKAWPFPPERARPPAGHWQRAEKLRLLQVPAAGVDSVLPAPDLVGLVAVIIGLMDAPADNLMAMLADNFIIVIGALAAAALIFGVVGLLLGKKSA